jgi:hypothetical protein
VILAEHTIDISIKGLIVYLWIKYMAPHFKDLLSQNEFWIFVFALGWALLNWPLITMAIGFEIRGIPMILVYITSIWLMIILALYIFDRRYSD